jgi:hypothetical protein
MRRAGAAAQIGNDAVSFFHAPQSFFRCANRSYSSQTGYLEPPNVVGILSQNQSFRKEKR